MMVLLGLGVSTAQADDGVLNFTGSVSSGACGIDATSKSLSVTYDAIPVATLNTIPAAGQSVPALQKAFSIKLVNCPESVSSASVNFDGAVSSYDDTIFVGGTVSYGGAIIQDAQTNEIITPKSFENSKTIVAGDNTLEYKVGLTKTRMNSASAGEINIPLSFTIQYN